MTEGPAGGPRPLADADGGPLGGPRPFAEPSVEEMVESFIEDEKAADQEYHNLVFRLNELGLEDEADIVEQIRRDEREHREMFEDMLQRIRGMMEE